MDVLPYSAARTSVLYLQSIALVSHHSATRVPSKTEQPTLISWLWRRAVLSDYVAPDPRVSVGISMLR